MGEEEEEEHDKSKIHTLTHFLTQSTLGHLICSYLSFLIISHFSAHQLTTHTHKHTHGFSGLVTHQRASLLVRR